jgi:hypothetical protein
MRIPLGIQLWISCIATGALYNLMHSNRRVIQLDLTVEPTTREAGKWAWKENQEAASWAEAKLGSNLKHKFEILQGSS